MFTNCLVLFLLLAIPANSICQPGHESVTVRITAEFFQRSLLRAPSYQKTTDYSREFSARYKEYDRSLQGNSSTGTEMEDSQLPVTQSYQPFSATVSADIQLVAISASSQDITDTVEGSPVGGSVTVTQIGTEFLRRTELTQANKYNPGFLQIVRRLTYYVSIGGKSASMVAETIYSSIPTDSSLSFTDLTSLGTDYISLFYETAGGQISVNSFVQTKCYAVLTTAETDRLTRLEDTVMKQKSTIESLKENQTAQDEELISLKGKQTTQNKQLITQFNSKVRSMNKKIASLNKLMTAQNSNITSLEENQTVQDAVLTSQTETLASLKNTLIVQDAEITFMKRNHTTQTDRLTRLGDTVMMIKTKQDSTSRSLTSLEDNQFTQDEVLLSQTDNLTSLQDELVSLKETLTVRKLKMITLEERLMSQELMRITQDDEIESLKENQTAHDAEITFLKQNQTTQASELKSQKRSLTHQNIQITSQSNKIIALENKQTIIVKAPTGSLRSEACLVTCVGSTGAGTTTWSSYSSGYEVYTTVSMTGCRFLYTPIISASVEGGSSHSYMTAAVYNAASSSFKVYMGGWVYSTRFPTGPSGYGTPSSRATSQNWNVNWHATGYIC